MKPLVVAVGLVAVAGMRGQNPSLERPLVAAEATWAAKRPAAYEFALELRCFCPVSRTPLVFRVSRNVATLLTKPADSQQTYSFYDHFNTIDKLFAVLRQRLVQKPHTMTVTYDPRSAIRCPRRSMSGRTCTTMSCRFA